MKTLTQPTNLQLTLHDRTHSPFPIYSVTLTLIPQIGSPTECRLVFQIALESYQHLEQNALLNLKPELRGSLKDRTFQPDLNIEIEATLQPDLLVDLIEHQDDIAAHLQNLSSDHPLLCTESWYALRVTQHQESGEVGYHTFWSYVNPAIVIQDDLSSEQISNRMVRFFRDWMTEQVEMVNENSFDNLLEAITQPFEKLLNESDRTIDEATDAIEDLLDELIDTEDQSLLQTVMAFFAEDDWQFTKLQGEPILHLVFQGNNGQWNCYAKVREEQQLIFYSICPIVAPESTRSAIAEFLTRANFGIVIGNFELNFDSGEIRYKTSIDVEGDDLSFSFIHQLVYTNIMTMDQYLPGIRAIIENQLLPQVAIAQVEAA
jgi:hypothetical protein